MALYDNDSAGVMESRMRRYRVIKNVDMGEFLRGRSTHILSFYYNFICRLFNYAFSSSDYIASNERMIYK